MSECPFFELIGNFLYCEDTIATATGEAKKSLTGCAASYVTQLTGHKSVNSLASYSACDIVQRKMARNVTENVDFSTHAACQAVSDSGGCDASGVTPFQPMPAATTYGAVRPARSRARQMYRTAAVVP